MATFNAAVFIQNLGTASVIVQDFAIITGLTLFTFGLFKLKRYGEMRTFMSQQMTMAKPMTLILCGSLLMYTPLLINSALAAFWGANAVNGYPSGGGMNFQMHQIENAITIFVRLIGVCSFIRGWMILARSGGEGSQPGTRGKGFIHIFSGILLMHILLTLRLLKAALGFN
jgi:intracellular multiplication protein IcmC